MVLALQSHESAPSDVRIRRGPDGLHLFNRKTGLNVLLDEITVSAASWDAAPRHVSIALTNACNLSCHYCYAPKHQASLEFNQVIGWLDELNRNGCLGIGFGGGEPTLYKRLSELCEYAARNTSLAVSVTSHGHLLTDALIRRLAGNVHFVRISMDGVRATYESLRGQSFTGLLERVKTVKKIASLGINFVVNAETFPDLPEAIQIAGDLGASEFTLLPEVRAAAGLGIDESTRTSMLKWIANYRGLLPLSISETGANGITACRPFATEDGLRAHAHVDASGILKRCSYDDDGVIISERGIMTALCRLRQRA